MLNLLLHRKKNDVRLFPLGQSLLSGKMDDNKFEIVRLLLTHHANPNVKLSNGLPIPLLAMEAEPAQAGSPNDRLLTLFLQNGANPNTLDMHNVSMLMYAVDGQNAPMVRTLLERGAQPNAENVNGDTALLWAAHHGEAPILRLLLAHGADLRTAIPASAQTPRLALTIQTGNSSMSLSTTNAATPGTTPLMFASRSGDTDLVRSMLAKGADANARDADGKTALDYARDSPEIRLLLQRAEARHLGLKRGVLSLQRGLYVTQTTVRGRAADCGL